MTEYNVGYKKPPVNNQFKKGQSGNPNGRRKGSLNLKKVLNNEINSYITLANGEVITKGEAIVKQEVNNAVMGNHKNVKNVINLMKENDKDIINEKFMKKFQNEYGISDNDIKQYVRNGSIYLNSCRVFDYICKEQILDYNMAFTGVREICFLSMLFQIDTPMDLFQIIIKSIITEYTFWETVEKMFSDFKIDEKTKKKITRKYQKERNFKIPSYELYLLAQKFLIFTKLKKREKYKEAINQNLNINFYKQAKEEFFSQSRIIKTYNMHKSQHPEFNLTREDFIKDIKLLEKNYKEFIDLTKDNSLEATFADITKLTINDFDALLDWYYDSKEFNCS